MKIILFGSGEGTSIKTVINSWRYCNIPISIEAILYNKSNQEMSNFCKDANIRYEEVVNEYKQLDNYKDLYEDKILTLLRQLNYDAIVLLGWNMILTTDFIKRVNAPIYNLHPALPNSYVGTGEHCIRQALLEFNGGIVKNTGSMIHRVTGELDRGEVICKISVPICETDSYEILRDRVKSFEKGLILSFLNILLNQRNEDIIDDYRKMTESKLYIGKVRRVEDIGYNRLLLTASDRLSAFDKHVCDVESKGICLNKMSEWWFNNTRHIIDNHYIHSSGKHMIVRKTNPIKLEIIVRGYMTGASPTSIWTMYSNGERNIYGINFRDGYNKNDKLDQIVITPTTKGKHDYPITPDEIVSKGFLSQSDYDFIANKSIELFTYGQKIARKRGFVLVDTKYEFGRLPDGSIILIDELHTCDSSRYWYLDENEDYTSPKKLDKDVVRDYLKQNNTDTAPPEVIQQVADVYNKYLDRFCIDNNSENDHVFHSAEEYCQYYFKNVHKNIAIIIAGSYSDSEFVEKIINKLLVENIHSIPYFYSAHKTPKKVLEILEYFDNFENRNIVYITVAGRSNALSGVVAANCKYPVIACPPFKDKDDFQVNINSTLQMPSLVPVMTILEPGNVALSIKRMFGSSF